MIGKTICVTAAGQGIGRFSADACVTTGAYVIAMDINAIVDDSTPMVTSLLSNTSKFATGQACSAAGGATI